MGAGIATAVAVPFVDTASIVEFISLHKGIVTVMTFLPATVQEIAQSPTLFTSSGPSTAVGRNASSAVFNSLLYGVDREWLGGWRSVKKIKSVLSRNSQKHA